LRKKSLFGEKKPAMRGLSSLHIGPHLAAQASFITDFVSLSKNFFTRAAH
jgi:hypothetical protein